MDARDRIMHGTITEELGLQGLNISFLHLFNKRVKDDYIVNFGASSFIHPNL